MKSNILPFGVIAIVGILAAIIVFYIGVNQKETNLAELENGGAPVGEETEDAGEPDAIYAKSCAGCHGADLSGAFGPDLQNVGSNHSVDEITDIILKGVGQMPAQNLTQEEADALSDWLVNNQ